MWYNWGLSITWCYLIIKLWLTKMLTTVNPCQTFLSFITPCYICWVWHVLTLAISPRPPVSSRSCSEDLKRYGGFTRRLMEVLGICYPQSTVPVKSGAWSLVTVPRNFDVSDDTTMYTLLNNIVFDIFHSIVVCVDFLGTHMMSLVLFFRKSGATMIHLDERSLFGFGNWVTT
jgi:hypothetical protein